MDFIYDNTGKPYAMWYGGDIYYYVLNLQGDVISIVTRWGESYGSYTYDAWGNIIAQSGWLAGINPIRYRGYYYDSETGLYYLQSRYYDPQVKRFINADDAQVSLVSDSFLSKNAFAYCNNCPTIAADQNGQWLNVVIGAVVGGVAGLINQATSDLIASAASGTNSTSNWETYVGAVLGGAVGGAILGATGKPKVANVVSSVVTTGAGLALEKMFGGKKISVSEIIINSAAEGAISIGMGEIGKIKSITKGRNCWDAVYKAGLTKLGKGTAKRMSAKVVLKGLGASTIGSWASNLYSGEKQALYNTFGSRLKGLLR